MCDTHIAKFWKKKSKMELFPRRNLSDQTTIFVHTVFAKSTSEHKKEKLCERKIPVGSEHS